MLAGSLPGGKGDMDLNCVFEAVGAYKAGKLDDAGPGRGGVRRVPGLRLVLGHVHGQLDELPDRGRWAWALPGNGTIPAVSGARLRLAKQAGMRAVEMVREGLTPDRILTPAAFRNALALDMALGCSTNSALHLPAIAHEAGVPFDLTMINELSARVPNLCHLAPAGAHHVQDLHEAGGVMAVLREISPLGVLDGEAMTCTGKTLAACYAGAQNHNPQVIRPLSDALLPDGRPDGAARQPRAARRDRQAQRRRAGDARA